MAASHKGTDFGLVVRTFARALLWTLAAFGTILLVLLAMLVWSGILGW
jgi:hypothetical protein